MKHRPILFAFCGPTASGKSTICKFLAEKCSDLMTSVSTTTRSPRSYEREGEHYYFVAKAEFEKRIQEGKFLDYDNAYGAQCVDLIWSTMCRFN